MYNLYCPNGTLSETMYYNRAINQANQNNNSRIPQPPIWHVFGSLIKAALLLLQGWVDVPNNNVQNRPEIFHFSIHPKNVFLADGPP
jgi:hypothetical protein